jgi:hypothetical protein
VNNEKVDFCFASSINFESVLTQWGRLITDSNTITIEYSKSDNGGDMREVARNSIIYIVDPYLPDWTHFEREMELAAAGIKTDEEV